LGIIWDGRQLILSMQKACYVLLAALMALFLLPNEAEAQANRITLSCEGSPNPLFPNGTRFLRILDFDNMKMYNPEGREFDICSVDSKNVFFDFFDCEEDDDDYINRIDRLTGKYYTALETYQCVVIPNRGF